MSIESKKADGDIMNMIQGTGIRPALANDYTGIMEIFKSWKSKDWDLEFAQRYYRDFWGARNCYPGDDVFVKIVGNQIVGTIGSSHDRSEAEDIYWLNWFYVHQSYIKNGYGEELLLFVIDRLKKAGGRKLYVDTSSNVLYRSAIKLYTKTGFKEEAALRDYYGAGEDQLILNLSFH